MKKVSKVKSVNAAFNSWEKDGTTFYPHRYEMEDGTQIDANHKQLNPFKVGDEVEYEVKGNDQKGNPKGSVGKVSQQNTVTQQSQYSDNSDAILFQVSLKIAGDVFVSQFKDSAITPGTSDIVNYAFEISKLSKSKIKELKGL